MIISIQTFCRKEKIGQDGTVLVYIRFTHNRIRRYVSTGIYIQASDWNFGNQCFNSNSAENEELRLKAENIRYNYVKRLKQLEALEKEITIDALLDEKKVKTTSYTLNQCLEQTIARLEALGKYNSASKHKTALSLLSQFRSTARLEDVNLQFLTDFELFLIQKGNQSNSIAIKFSLLKAAYNSIQSPANRRASVKFDLPDNQIFHTDFRNIVYAVLAEITMVVVFENLHQFDFLNAFAYSQDQQRLRLQPEFLSDPLFVKRTDTDAVQSDFSRLKQHALDRNTQIDIYITILRNRRADDDESIRLGSRKR